MVVLYAMLNSSLINNTSTNQSTAYRNVTGATKSKRWMPGYMAIDFSVCTVHKVMGFTSFMAMTEVKRLARLAINFMKPMYVWILESATCPAHISVCVIPMIHITIIQLL